MEDAVRQGLWSWDEVLGPGGLESPRARNGTDSSLRSYSDETGHFMVLPWDVEPAGRTLMPVKGGPYENAVALASAMWQGDGISA